MYADMIKYLLGKKVATNSDVWLTYRHPLVKPGAVAFLQAL